MKAAIICPGPSVLKTLPDDFGGLKIGVNRAGTFFQCDVFACGDYPALERDLFAANANTLLTTEGGVEHLAKIGYLWPGHRVLTFESLFAYLHPSTCGASWSVLTMLAAIVYASFRGADRIEVYGADWEGVEDFDGVEAGNNRTAERWKLEREIFVQLTGVLDKRFGHKLLRITE